MKTDTHTFHIQTFGCQMNANDSEWLERALKARGLMPADIESAFIHILNTCSVRDKPEQKVYSEIGRLAHRARVTGRRIVIGVAGCVAQQVGEELFRRFPEVRLVFGTDGISQAPAAIGELAENPGMRQSWLDFSGQYEERPGFWREDIDARGAPPAAFVNIMQGCDNFCAYCIVPMVRGRQRSRTSEAVLGECRTLLEGGTREITLLGQNVNSYGQDRYGDGTPFSVLLEKVLELPGLERLRFVTPHPKDIAPEVIEAFKIYEKLCPRLHLPVQSGADRILKKMGRRYDTSRYLRIVDDLKKARPDMVLTTDIIVGFPGETEEDFQETMRLMEEVGFIASFSFVYSDRPGAKAVMLMDKVERAVALERLSRLQAWQIQASEKVLAGMIGREDVILIEGESDRAYPASGGSDTVAAQSGAQTGKAWQGRTAHGHTVNLTLPSGPNVTWAGKMLPVLVESAGKHTLKGRQAGEPW